MTINESRLIAIFCFIDDFCKLFEAAVRNKTIPALGCRRRAARISLSEMLTILVCYHLSPTREFKYCYQYFIHGRYRGYFNSLSYNRFVALMPRTLLPLTLLLQLLRGKKTGTYFIDSTKIAVCNNKRINRNRVFAGLAARGKSSYGWFFGFKLHIIINDKGELIAFKITRGNADDRSAVPILTRSLRGSIYADKGYISQNLFLQLFNQGLKLVTGITKNMKNRLMLMMDKILLRKRSAIETVFSILKSRMNLEHTRHRSPTNFLINVLSCLAAYCFRSKKPYVRVRSLDLGV
jgi:hypothetical protein